MKKWHWTVIEFVARKWNTDETDYAIGVLKDMRVQKERNE